MHCRDNCLLACVNGMELWKFASTVSLLAEKGLLVLQLHPQERETQRRKQCYTRYYMPTTNRN